MMKMKLHLQLRLLLVVVVATASNVANAFVAPFPTFRRSDAGSREVRLQPPQQQTHIRTGHYPGFALLIAASSAQDKATNEEAEDVNAEEKLMHIAKRLRLEAFDLEDGIFGFESKDNRYGIEVIHTTIHRNPTNEDEGLGLVLTEMASSPDGRGLVLISQVSGNAASADPQIHVGDVVTGVVHPIRMRTTELNYDGTVEAIDQAKQASTDDGNITLELNRLVERAPVRVVVDLSSVGASSSSSLSSGSNNQTLPSTMEIEALAGENLRRLLLRRGVQLYDPNTKRFDMPYAKGDCAGDGLCGTCLVAVQEGMELLNPMGSDERLITKGRPASWRAACRAVVGADNVPGTLRIQIHPQTQFHDELEPGVKSLTMDDHQ